MTKFFYPRATLRKMQVIGLKESDIEDVFKNGTEISGKSGKSRKYNGYEIGLFYTRDNLTDEYHITAVWKKIRR